MRPDQFIQVGALRVRYWHADEQGSPLLLIHGIGVAVEWFAENMATLAQRHGVYAVDLPDHGQTDKPPTEQLALLRLRAQCYETLGEFDLARVDYEAALT